MPIRFASRFYYDGGRDAVLLRAFVGGEPVDVFLPFEVLVRRYGADAGASKELAARLAVLAHGDAPARAREAGFDALLAKPSEPAELLRLVVVGG